MEKMYWKDHSNERYLQLYHKVPLAVLGAINDIRLGISRGDYFDWALAMGFSAKTATFYWNVARRLVRKAPDNVRFICE